MTFLPQITAEKMASQREALFRACHKCSFEMREIKRKHVLMWGVKKNLEPLRFRFFFDKMALVIIMVCAWV